MAFAVEGCREHPRQGKRADWPDGANRSAGDKRAFARGHGVVQSSGRAPVIRDRVLPGVQNAMSSTCASVTSVESMVQAATSLPKLCIVDLDKTVWDSFSASTTEPPYVRVCAPSTTAAG